MFQGDMEKRLVLGRKIEDTRRQKGWSRSLLANKAGYDERTVRNAVNGHRVKEQTIFDLCNALELQLDDVWGESSFRTDEVAPATYGSYSKAAAKRYEGKYLAFRRGFSENPAILRSIYEIHWNENIPGLAFYENQNYTGARKQKIDNSQDGNVYISDFTGLVHLMTVAEGSVRLLTLTKLKNDIMEGSVLTQSERTMFYQPSVSAIRFQKIPSEDEEQSIMPGPLDPDSDEYQNVNEELLRIEKEIIFISSKN
jgi:transcriptional regulator with XRE-family HTH domain